MVDLVLRSIQLAPGTITGDLWALRNEFETDSFGPGQAGGWVGDS